MAATAVELLIESTNYARPRDRARELWAFREVILAFAERNVRVKYKQAVLGVLWAVLQPLIILGVFMVVFGRMANISAGSTSYPAFALAALVPWFFVQTAVTFGAQALLMDSALLRKVYFPRETPVLGAVLSAGLDFAMGFALLMALEPVLGGHLSWNVLMVVPLWLTLAVLTTGVSLILGALNVYYRDFRFVLPVLLQLWMFASPVAYPLSAVRAQWRELYIVLNPAAGILEGFRRALAEGHLPDLGLLALSAGTSCLVAWIGYWFFKRMEPGLADVV